MIPSAIQDLLLSPEGREEIANLPLAWHCRTVGGVDHEMKHVTPDETLCGRPLPPEVEEEPAAGDGGHCPGCLAEAGRLYALLPAQPRNRDLWAITGEPPPGWR